MDIWAEYPDNYRQVEVQRILGALGAGECVSVVGLSGAGKSNLAGFLVQRCAAQQPVVLVDCNRLDSPTREGFFHLVGRVLGEPDPIVAGLDELERVLEPRLAAPDGRLCLAFDRFDALPADLLPPLSGNLRALRDAHKYRLTYLTFTRRPLDAHSELGELFYAHTLWLGVLSESDARWSIASYARRSRQNWDEPVFLKIMQLSGCYPSFLRAVCEAAASDCPLELAALQAHPAVQRRVEEFWADQPSPGDLRLSGLEGHPLLALENRELTAKEALLLKYLQAHPDQVCEKDELMRAVWPEIKVYAEGMQDDSLAQLVRRLRRKIETDPSNPGHLFNVPGRGYRYVA